MDNIPLIYDKTGSPLIGIKKMKLFVHVLPVTKVQFEKFIAEVNLPDFSDEWYENILKLNSRVSYKKFTEENYWKLFITGIYPEEAMKFAEYLGNDYRLPDVDEWREIYRYFKYSSLHFKVKGKPGILKRLEKFIGNDLFSLTLMEKGIAEWVKEGRKYVGVGKPDSNFQQSALKPLYDKIDPVGERLSYVGFRLVKDM